MAAIVFDLDGTLIDSAPDIRAALNRVLEDEGVPLLSLTETVRSIGHGVPALIAQARALRDLPEARQDAMVAAMVQHYGAASAVLTRPYPGVAAALEALAAAGHVLGLCTNKPIAPTRAILDALDLARHFQAVIGGDSLPQRKPDPAPLHAAYAALAAPVLLYVGDSEVDAETAQAAGVDFALFTPGYRKSAVEALVHRLAFDDFAALPGLVAALR
ncbi:phosphoglycolate phosphatase [Gemmobacter sp.]|uniref:phosphoglycolate phosphatase n=1 Tax=Gemmobacter sp. TaxID=1898957 RepID=UPI002AFF01D7|nr:phosphoglycolate phosphatase [Gemmobacter sp.]